jgi:hypothetical protein
MFWTLIVLRMFHQDAHRKTLGFLLKGCEARDAASAFLSSTSRIRTKKPSAYTGNDSHVCQTKSVANSSGNCSNDQSCTLQLVVAILLYTTCL